METGKTDRPAARTGRYFKYAVGEIILVVVGILIALSINNWNENRKERLQEQSILKGLQFDLRLDINAINKELKNKEEEIEGFTNCLEILTTDNQATKAQFMEDFKFLLFVGGISLNKTTFNNLQTSGQISFIKDKDILDSILNYYNTNIDTWESANKEYTRTIVAPYLYEFDYLPHLQKNFFTSKRLAKAFNAERNILPSKPLKAYKQDFFIINALGQKSYNIEGLIDRYEFLKKKAQNLDSIIQTYLEKQ